MAGLFGSLGRRPKRRRGPAKPGPDQLASLEASYIRWCKAHDPAKFGQIMDGRLGIASQKSDLERFIETKRALRDAGLDGEESSFGEFARAVPAILGMLTGSVVPPPPAGEHRPAGAPPGIPGAPALPAAGTPAALPPARPRRAARRAGRPGKKRREAERAAQGNAPRHAPVSDLFMAGLGGKAPDEAALWLLRSEEPLVKRLVPILLRTPDVALPAALSKLARDPDWAAFASWLREHEPWTRRVIAELRRLARDAAASA